MPNLAPSSPVRRIVQLADQIEADIQRRNLKVGDRYLRTDETAKMLGVEIGAANRAMQLLAHRKRLVRRPRSGTFVAEPAQDDLIPKLHRVRILGSEMQRSVENFVQSGELVGLQRELPGVKIELDAVPVLNEEEYLKSIVGDALKAREPEGVILHSSTMNMQRIIGSSGLPVVIQGHRRPSVTGIPFLNSDHRQVGKLAVEYLLSQGFQRVALLARHRSAHQTMDAIRTGLHAAGLGLPAFEMRLIFDDREEITAVVNEMLDASNQRTGFVALSKLASDAVVDIAAARQLEFGRDIDVVLSDFPVAMEELPPYPWIERAISAVEYGARVAQLLKQVVRQGTAATSDVIIPVHLRMPEGTVSDRKK